MDLEKKTKIVVTIGPVSDNEKTLGDMMDAGLNVARLNFSHGSHSDHFKALKLIRKVAKRKGRAIAVLQDLSGPKIRIGEFEGGKIVLKEGQIFTLTTKKILGNNEKVSLNYKNLPKSVKKGDSIMIEDGSKRLEVMSVSREEVKCRVIVGGDLKSNKGVNLPGANLKISSLTAKDKKDLKFGLKNGVDYVALSFVRRAKDISDLKKVISKHKSKAKVIAKIETQEAVSNIDEIIEKSDGVMVARGDLGIEMPLSELPLIQKMIIKKCNSHGKPVITATQMLESMIKNPLPTRAEAADVANAILDGTDAVMLSEETTLGKYPVLTVKTMAIIAKKAEVGVDHKEILDSFQTRLDPQADHMSIVDAVSYAVCRTALRLNAKLIVVYTDYGFTSRMISRWKPKQPILALTPNGITYNWTALQSGVLSKIVPMIKTDTEMIALAKREARASGLAKKGDKIIISAGIPFGQSGTTNLLLVQTV